MNKTYRRNEQSKKHLVIGGAMFALFVLIATVARMFLPSLSDLASRIAIPVWTAGEHASLVASLGGIGAWGGGLLVAENRALKEEIEALRNERATVFADAHTYTELMSRFGRSLEEERMGILAGVLSTPPRSLYDTIVIDAGSRNGVSVGMLVYANSDMPVGVVARVGAVSSVVELLSSPGRHVEVVVGASGEIRASAEGLGGGNFVIRIPRDISISVGDPVSLPTLSGACIGYVSVVDAVPTDSFQTIRFSFETSLQDLRFVMIRPYGTSIFLVDGMTLPSFGTEEVSEDASSEDE